MSGFRVLASLVLLALSITLPVTPPALAAEGDTLAAQALSPSVRFPLAPGVAANIRLTLRVTLASAAAESVRLVGFSEGKGDAIPLSADVPVTQATTQVALTGSYTPPATGVRWLAVKAVLGPTVEPLAQLTLRPYLVMDSVVGERSIAYFTPGISPDLAHAYNAVYNSAWQKMKDDLDLVTTPQYELFLAADPDVFEQAMVALANENPSYAAMVKNSSGGFEIGGRDAMVINNVVREGSYINVSRIGHEYTHNFFPGSNWYGEGIPDLLGVRLSYAVAGARCQAEDRIMGRWADTLNGLRDGKYLPLSAISTREQWRANASDVGAFGRQYGEGYTAVEYWESRHGFAAIAKFLKHPKGATDFAAAFAEVTGQPPEQFEQDYLAALRAKLDQPPPSIPLTIRLAAAGITPQTHIYFNTLYGPTTQGQGFRTPRGLAPGDYAFEIGPDGAVRSTDGKTTLEPFPVTLTGSPRGRSFVVIDRPGYRGTANVEGAQILRLLAVHGRAGLVQRHFQPSTAGVPSEFPAGDCLDPWPDGNRIQAATDLSLAPRPVLGGPAHGVLLPGLAASLAWTNPPNTTQYQLQVIPANNDGPGINVIRNAEASFPVQAPVLGQGPYVMLPGMTYTWRVRTASAAAGLGENDPGWGPWAEPRTFRTPVRDSARLTAVAPVDRGTLGSGPQALRWSNGHDDVFYYEIQVSGDPQFREGAAAVSFVWQNLVHGGTTSPANSWNTPPLTPNTTYHWRVRPRVQGDGTPVAWSQTWSFRTGP
ncbi:MAG: hypothetical protein HYY02_10645 [Chloroflexi bacterium]|nr:hypothetical protein [Chloroflexota bacterium]